MKACATEDEFAVIFPDERFVNEAQRRLFGTPLASAIHPKLP